MGSGTKGLAGVSGCAYGESSTFHLLFGHAAPAGLDAVTLKDGVPGWLSPALHCAMLSRGVHLFGRIVGLSGS